MLEREKCGRSDNEELRGWCREIRRPLTGGRKFQNVGGRQASEPSPPCGSQSGSLHLQTITPAKASRQLQACKAVTQLSHVQTDHTGQFLEKVGIEPAKPHATTEVGLCAAAGYLNGLNDSTPHFPNRLECTATTCIECSIR